MILPEQIGIEGALVGNNNIKFVMTRFSRLVVYNLYIATKEVLPAGSSPRHITKQYMSPISTDAKCRGTEL